jgi:cation transport protein ChaC
VANRSCPGAAAAGGPLTRFYCEEGGLSTANEDAPRQALAAFGGGTQPVWIFAYGSLIWEPEFCFVEAEPALLRGYHRSCCLYSFDYRGTRERPGLVLGLDRGGSCRGMAFRLAPEGLQQSLDRLWQREMTPAPPVYEPRRLRVRCASGTRTALAFVVRRDLPDYAGRLPLDAAARLIALATGRRGSCRDYLEKTLAHLAAHGILDAGLRRLARRVAAIVAGPDDPAETTAGLPEAANLSTRVRGDFLEQ